jgi:hypothetical protein
MARRKEKRQSFEIVERFSLFRKRVIELSKLRLVQSEAQSKYQISWDAESGQLTYQAQEPDEEDLKSFLLLFRHFISSSEPIFINRVFNDCLRFLDDECLKGEVQKAKEAWRKELQSGTLGMQVNEANLTPEYVLNLWINGYYFHNDPEKTFELESLLKQPLPLVRMQFISCLPNLFQIIFYMGRVISYGLDNGLFKVPNEST